MLALIGSVTSFIQDLYRALTALRVEIDDSGGTTQGRQRPGPPVSGKDDI
jgi:hypothetical protein